MPITLQEQPNGGRTIIEIRAVRCIDGIRNRTLDGMMKAEQNVVFEPGSSWLPSGEIELWPSMRMALNCLRMSGILYSSLGWDWQLELAGEMKSASLCVDANNSL